MENALFACKDPVERHEFLGLTALVASSSMRQLLEQARRAALSAANVLITGESGTGKEVAARAIHAYSPRAARAWVDFSCAALPELLLESELFGHEKGAFSGADSPKPGLFELAHDGTIFLDEVGELDLRMQVKLLRVLDGVPYYRLGGTRKVSTDVRVVAATNQDLELAVAERRFRADLYHRLGQVRLRVPPLRERLADIAPLAHHFLERHDPTKRLDERAIATLQQYSWPGNLRELRNIVTQAAVMTHGSVLTAADLSIPRTWQTQRSTEDEHAGPRNTPAVARLAYSNSRIAAVSKPAEAPSASSLDDMERRMIAEALRATGGHQQKAALRLGISRRTLSRKLKLYQAGRLQVA